MSVIRNRGTEFASDDIIQNTKPGAKLGLRQPAIEVQQAEERRRGSIAFQGVAWLAAGNEVAAGIILGLDAWDDVIQAAVSHGEPGAAIKTPAAFARMNRAAQRRAPQEVPLVEGVVANATAGITGHSNGKAATNLAGKTHLDQVTGFIALHQPQDPTDDQAAHGLPHGSV